MAKNINIGGRLHSVASGNVVAGANEIFDDAEGKKQDVINAELRAGIEEAGKVDDVEVNGQSVLDPQTKTASITVPVITVEGETLIF